MYPFSIVSPHSVVYLNGENSYVSGSIETVELVEGGSEEIMLVINNLGNTPKNIKVRLYLPNELKTEEEERSVTLGSRDKKEIKYRIESSGALPGSSYSILASLEYDSGYHYTSFANGLVKIIEDKEVLGISYSLVIVILITLMIIFVSYQIWGMVSEKKSDVVEKAGKKQEDTY